MTELSTLLKFAREELLKLTAEAAVATFRVDRSDLYNWESGNKASVSPGYVEKLAQAIEAKYAAERKKTAFAARSEAYESVPAELRWLRLPDYRKSVISTFFGHDAVQKGIDLVYPEFALSDPARARLADLDPFTWFENVGSGGKQRQLVDLQTAVAANDLTALLRIWQTLLTPLGLQARVIVDRAVVDEGAVRPFISFGLSSNECTRFYLDEERDSLFRVLPADSGTEEVVVLPNNKRFMSTAPHARGLILRSTPSPRERPGQRWFLCAGLGAGGTVGAAHYLATHWRRLHSLFGSRDFVAVIRVNQRAPQRAELEDWYPRPPE